MITRSIFKCWGLAFRSRAPVYIYLRDHNQHINPSTSLLNLSYRNPRNLVPNAPVHQFVEYQLNEELQELIDRQTFEEYKNKVLRGIVDEEQQVLIRPPSKSQTRSGEKALLPSTTTSS